MTKATDRQKEIYNFIQAFFDNEGYYPTLEEIGDNYNMTKKGACDHVAALERKGYLIKIKKKSRAYRMLKGIQ